MRSVYDYLGSSRVEDWRSGLSIARDSIDDDLAIFLFTLYFSESYIDIRSEVRDILEYCYTERQVNYAVLLDMVNSEKRLDLLNVFVSSLGDENIIAYSRQLFKSESSLRSLMLEQLGIKILNPTLVSRIYQTLSKDELSGLFYTAGYMGNEINPWLTEMLYNEDEEIASSALFALSKHGSAGFSIIADHLINLSDRLKVVSIDLLTYNKVYAVYEIFPEMLIRRNEIISNRIFNALTNLGNNGVFYILECLKVCDPYYYRPLLGLLVQTDYQSYLDSIYFLIREDSLKESLLGLFFDNEAIHLLQRIVWYEDEEIVSEMVDFGVRHNSPILFYNTVLSEVSLRYFLKKDNQDTVLEYFRAIERDSKYVGDYLNLVEIYNSLVTIREFESKNGEVDFVSGYFEIEQNELIADREKDAFYKGMEDWLETRNNEDLKRSLEIKKFGIVDRDSVNEIRTLYMDSLDDEQKLEIEEYEKAKLEIIRNYRVITFRLKSFAGELIIDSGFSDLIK